ncbi:12945_t:CDS:2 [Ambispora gerdemannii]|uniref:12945_t:CDS:1 n=1 Tax=Ambispora gerdemannii TaxID=144530 RepID=A0A9N8VJS2_9GLOM|nr:12945_t:CDS:2 [Ambispora gerdemannii]
MGRVENQEKDYIHQLSMNDFLNLCQLGKSKEHEEQLRVRLTEFTRLESKLEQIARRKLKDLDKAISLEELAQVPSNRLHKLTRDRKGQHIIMKSKKLPPIHPGEMLREEFLVPLNMKPEELAKKISVPAKTIKDICMQQDYERECLEDILESQEKQIKKEIHPLPNFQSKTNEESTTNRDKLKEQNEEGKGLGKSAIRASIKGLNFAVKAYNLVVANAVKYSTLGAADIKLKEINENQTLDEIMKSGGTSVALGLIDDAVKGVRRVGLPAINAIQVFGVGGPQAVAAASKVLSTVEFAIDHLKDMLTSSAISGLAAEVGDLKDGQAKLNSKVDAQGKLMNKRMGDLKSELQGELKQQGEKFDKEIKDLDKKLETATGENRKRIEEEKKQRQAQYQELKSSINEVTENLNRVESKLTEALQDFKSEVNERFEQQERKILANKQRIEEERRKREAEIQEINSKIKVTSTNLENLRQEKEELSDNFDKYKSQIDQKTAETQQVLEDTQAEYERKTAILETQIKDNEEIINEFQEDLTTVRNEQAKQRLQQEEILEELQETNDILFAQQRKLNLVADQMNDIQEEVHERMDKLSEKLDTRINETLNVVQDTNKKLDKLTDEVQNIREETEKLQEQIKQNKLETEKAKQEAKLANERLDNLIKAQSLSDYSAQESKIDKIQKSLELKAEEAKLLATLNLLQETKKLIPKEPAEREVKGEHEQAPLTDPEKRKEQQVDQTKREESKAAGEETKQAEVLEELENLKTETLQQLATIQQQISQQLDQAEEEPIITKTKPLAKYDPQIKKSQQKVQKLQKTLANKKATTQQSVQKALNNPTPQNKKEVQQSQQEEKKIEKELGQAQTELENLEKSQVFEQDLEKQEEEIREAEKEEIEQT